MKQLYFLITLLCFAFGMQSQTVNDCNNAQNICSNPSFMFQGINGVGLTGGLNVSNPSTNPQMGNALNPTSAANSGCLLTNGPGPQWLLLTVSSSGNLGFCFGANGSTNPQAGLYDWAMWLYTPTTCANIFNNTQPPVSCNWNGTNVGGTGMGPIPPGGDTTNYQPSIPVTVGQQYLILISNYSGVNTAVSFTSTGTAGLSCGFNAAICAGNTVTVTPVGFIPLTGSSFTLLPQGLTNSTGSFVVTPSVTTTYTIQNTGTNSQSQQVTQTSTTNITVNSQPSVAPTSTQTSCTSTVNGFDLNPSFNPASPVPSYTVSWVGSTPNGLNSFSQTAAGGGTVTINAGTYTAVLTADGGCTTQATFTINPVPAPSIFSLSPAGSNYTVTCAQPTITITASEPGYTYNWNNGIIAPKTGSTTGYDQFGVGNWTVTGTNPASGCVSIHTFTVYKDITPPTSSVTPLTQVINCTNNSVATATGIAVSPTTNVTHIWYAPGAANQ